jgi:hypothetical protein
VNSVKRSLAEFRGLPKTNAPLESGALAQKKEGDNYLFFFATFFFATFFFAFFAFFAML